MGIYLPNIEMPRKGEMLVIFPDGTSYVCFNGMRERLNHTTAFSVPPHGRLGDLDKLALEMMDAANADQALAMLDDAPTIIQAEQAEEGE